MSTLFDETTRAAIHARIDRLEATRPAATIRFAERRPEEPWAPHPAFGPLAGREWGRLCYKHLDHHLRQFAA